MPAKRKQEKRPGLAKLVLRLQPRGYGILNDSLSYFVGQERSYWRVRINEQYKEFTTADELKVFLLTLPEPQEKEE